MVYAAVTAVVSLGGEICRNEPARCYALPGVLSAQLLNGQYAFTTEMDCRRQAVNTVQQRVYTVFGFGKTPETTAELPWGSYARMHIKATLRGW